MTTNAAMVTLSRLMRLKAMRAGERPAMAGTSGREADGCSSAGSVVPVPIGTGWCCVVIVRTSRV
ncbi:hypothetical protein GCM10022232_52690 [Streptomyces plumbiresistens]|uniref:Uncharacterized protein n=1 Tax=Streptomyces plumbiresistens TaxID=511811 RepID=A0ABP7S422_9ACTN